MLISHYNPNDMLSIQMIKLYRNSICKPLPIIFSDCLNEGKIPHEWKKANVVSTHKKENRLWKTIGLSLYSLFAAKFLSVSFITKCLPFFTQNNSISPTQSGFRPGDSCVNQLPAIAHKIYESFDKGFGVTGVLSDITKAFDKVWHEGLLLKLNEWYFWKSFETFTQFSFLLKTTSSSKWSALILGCYHGSPTGFFLRALIVSYL